MSEHTHDHSYAHSHVHTNNKKVLLISFILIFTFMIVEIIGGIIANSLALLSDGVHMLSDAISLGVALIAFIYAEKHPTVNKTFGYKRFEILAALFNGALLFVISIFIIIEAIQRFMQPAEVQSTQMFIISIIGLIINVIIAVMMFAGSDTEHNLNMRGAFLHVIGDLLGSIGALIAAVLIWLFGWNLADPIVSILMSLIILKGAWGVLKSSLNILMEGTPENVDLNTIIEAITEEPEIDNVHDCHIWTISNDMNALSCHAVVSPTLTMVETEAVLKRVEHKLNHLNIQHVTIQLETANHDHEDAVFCSTLHHDEHQHLHSHA